MTDIALREYFEMLLDQSEKRNVERVVALEKQTTLLVAGLKELAASQLKAQEIAIEKSAAQYDSRFALANEFRNAMSDLSGTFITKNVVDEKFESGSIRIGLLEQRLANIDGRIIGYSAGIGVVVLIISIVSQLLNIGG